VAGRTGRGRKRGKAWGWILGKGKIERRKGGEKEERGGGQRWGKIYILQYLKLTLAQAVH
jgi:hypothetical protein